MRDAAAGRRGVTARPAIGGRRRAEALLGRGELVAPGQLRNPGFGAEQLRGQRLGEPCI